MHERPIAEELVEQVVARARSKGISQLTRIGVSLGKDSDITGEALNCWFDLLKAGTIAEQAVLEVETAPGGAILLLSLEGQGMSCPETDP